MNKMKKLVISALLANVMFSTHCNICNFLKNFFFAQNNKETKKERMIKQIDSDNGTPEKRIATTHKRILHSIIGGAVGDAMGKPTEFIRSIHDILEQYPGGLRSFYDFKEKDFFEKRGKTYAPYTDDTGMAKIVLEVLLETKQSNFALEKTMKKIAKEFVNDMSNKDGWAAYYRAPGNACIKNCKKLRKIILDKKKHPEKYKNIKWWRVGKTGTHGDGGCGSVMRTHPFGLIFAQNPQKAEDWAVEHSRLTHGADIALAACAAMAVGTAYAVQGKDPGFIVQQMIKSAKKYDKKTAKKIEAAYKAALKNKKSCKTLEDMLKKSKTIFETYLGWAAHDAIAATVYIFALCPDNIEHALALGTNTPGDSDSIASMAGALVGATGNNTMPQWVKMVESYKYLSVLARDVWELF